VPQIPQTTALCERQKTSVCATFELGEAGAAFLMRAKKNARAEGKKVKFSFCLSRSVRESVAHLPREEDQEAEDEREKGQPEPRLQRGAGL
jgi:hypothetical protein